MMFRLLLPFLLAAALVGVSFGDTVSGSSLSITRDGEEFTVSGILYGKDGKPTAGATVLLYENSNGRPTKDVKEEEPDRTDE